MGRLVCALTNKTFKFKSQRYKNSSFLVLIQSRVIIFYTLSQMADLKLVLVLTKYKSSDFQMMKETEVARAAPFMPNVGIHK